MHQIFLLIVFATAAYFFVRPRGLDALGVLYFSAVFYYAPALIGHVYSYKSYAHLEFDFGSYDYFTIALYLCVCTGFTILADSSRRSDPVLRGMRLSAGEAQLYAWGFLACAMISGVIGVATNPAFLDASVSKSDLMLKGGSAAIWPVLFQLFTAQGVIAAYLGRQKTGMLAGAFLCLVSMYIGFRLSTALCAIGIAYMSSVERPEPLIRKAKILLSLACGYLLLVVGKQSYSYLKSGDMETLKAFLHYRYVIHNPFESLLVNAENESVTIMYLAGVQANVKLGMEHLLDQWSAFIPFAGIFGLKPGSTYNYHVQEPLLYVPNDVVGLGSSSLGEWHAIGGPFGLILLATVWVGILLTLEGVLRKRPQLAGWIVPLIVLVGFYSYRNGIDGLAYLIKWHVIGGAMAVGTINLFLQTPSNEIRRTIPIHTARTMTPPSTRHSA